jgi:hypothetical protein
MKPNQDTQERRDQHISRLSSALILAIHQDWKGNPSAERRARKKLRQGLVSYKALKIAPEVATA